jgi:uncharacterized membrane protein YccC
MKKELSDDAKKILKNNIELWRWICLGVLFGLFVWFNFNLFYNDDSKDKLYFANYMLGVVSGIAFSLYVISIWKGFTSWKNKYK